LTGQPALAPVATAGTYASLTGQPVLATVASSGKYTDLTGQPTIPAAQVCNWTETNTTAADYITNKRALAAVATAGTYASLPEHLLWRQLPPRAPAPA